MSASGGLRRATRGKNDTIAELCDRVDGLEAEVERLQVAAGRIEQAEREKTEQLMGEL